MKRFAAISLSLMMMITNVFADSLVSVKLNGEDVVFNNQEPTIVDGRTLIPLRSIFESIGYDIEWQADTKTAVLKSDTQTVTVTANADSFSVDGKEISLDTPAQIINGSMMLPLRAIGEASGLTVGWDNETKVVSLTTKEAETNKNTAVESEAKAEMDKFYENIKADTTISAFFVYGGMAYINDMDDILEELDNGRLAFSKGAERTKATMAYIDKVIANTESLKVPEEYKTAKSYVVEYFKYDKSYIQIYNNYFNNVYPDDESFEKDFEALGESSENYFSLLTSELSKLDNQAQRIVSKYFDTDKDTEENKKNIEAFVAEIGAIAEKYPLPFEEVFDDNDDVVIIAENIDSNIEKINDAIKGREEEFNKITPPENCKERLELIKRSNDTLKDLVSALETYKNYGSSTLNPYEQNVFASANLYDIVSVLASDYKLGLFLGEEKKEFDFEKHIDNEFSSIDLEDISKETSDFINNYYYMSSIENYINQNDYLNDFYSIYLNFDDTTTSTGRNAGSFFDMWLQEQNKVLGYLKNCKVSEAIMDLKSTAINYLDLDIQYTKLMQNLYTKKIAEDRFNQEEEKLTEKLDYAFSQYETEANRVSTNLDSFLYDYLDYDMVRTDNAEVQEFGKKILEINKKYPLDGDDYKDIKWTDDGKISKEGVSNIKYNLSRGNEMINKREEEYKSIDVPEKCKKRMEIILAAGKIVKDYANNVEIKADDEDSTNEFAHNVAVDLSVYDELMYLATGGAELDEE
ncbi:MAG: stalk domain-containing protein [Lachnospirales bacterium]